MTTKLEICNAALIRCGAEPIGDFDTDQSKRAALLRNQYDITRREILNDTTWNFATNREQSLVKNITAPSFGFAFAYDIPAGILRVLEVNACDDYRIEGNKLLTNYDSTTLLAKCIMDITDETLFTASFTKAFVLKLAEDISYALVQSSALQQSIISEAERYLRRARSYNSQEGTPADRYPTQYTTGIRL